MKSKKQRLIVVWRGLEHAISKLFNSNDEYYDNGQTPIYICNPGGTDSGEVISNMPITKKQAMQALADW